MKHPKENIILGENKSVCAANMSVSAVGKAPEHAHKGQLYGQESRILQVI